MDACTPQTLSVIAHIRNDFPTKFGLPRQSGLIDTLESFIVFETPYRNPDALRGLDGFSHLWLLWGFQLPKHAGWSPTVRPPRLGGNKRMGVFATRSPNRPNPIGLTCVRLLEICHMPAEGTILRVSGADAMDGTPVYDIKPYLPYADAYPDAIGGFANQQPEQLLQVIFPPALLSLIPTEKRATLHAVLSGDPRPAYQNDPKRIYGFSYAGFDIRFTVSDATLTVTGVITL